MSPFSWFVIIYVCVGTHIMMEALVEAWNYVDYSTWTKVVGSAISILVWPLVFFM